MEKRESFPPDMRAMTLSFDCMINVARNQTVPCQIDT